MGAGNVTLDNSGFRNGTWNPLNWDWNPFRNQNPPPTQSPSVITPASTDSFNRDFLNTGSQFQKIDYVPQSNTILFQYLNSVRSNLIAQLESYGPDSANMPEVARLKQTISTLDEKLKELEDPLIASNYDLYTQAIKTLTGSIQPPTINT
jgi:hypothetical protein